MKRKIEKFKKHSAFTIVELLTVMSIIIILIGLLVPGLNQVRRYALYVKQRNQFKAIGQSIEFFNVEFQGYPDSGALDQAGIPYCGAMKLCEAMVGQDFLGFNPDSRFFQIGTKDGGPPDTGVLLSAGGNDLYPVRPTGGIPGSPPRGTEPQVKESIRERKALYLPLETANAYRLGDIYINSPLLPLDLPVLCDVYNKVINVNTGRNIGMPVLYYKANTSNIYHFNSSMPLESNIYNSTDNQALIDLGLPWEPLTSTITHPMSDPADPIVAGKTTPDGMPPDPTIFYLKTRNPDIDVPNGRPYKADSFILMSAGFDGLYGTKDDVFDFEK